VNTVLERLRSRGWALTPQRRVVAEVLSGDHIHLTADDIHELAVARLPEISRATVYKTLNELVALGEVRSIALGGRAKHYDPNPDTAHHHLVCDRCGRTLDVHPAGLEKINLQRSQRHGYKLGRTEIVFRGICPECLTAEDR
jgi:Fur family transcriptional regulator, stress-responsive regulator